MRIVCVHTAQSNIGVFDRALGSIGAADVELRHVVRADLLAAAEAAGALTDAVSRETAALLAELTVETDGVLLTCSTLGPVVATLQRTSCPIMRVDQALAAQAVARGGNVTALCTVSTTVAATTRLFEDEAAAAGANASVSVELVADAWAMFKSGDTAAYYAAIAAAADDALASGADVVALAQASMAEAAAMCQRSPVISSPTAGLTSLIRAASVGR
jgi:Asp/Glu/hydantoin racemase